MATIYRLAANTTFYFNSIGVDVSTDNVDAAFWRYSHEGVNYVAVCMASDFPFQSKLTYSGWVNAFLPETIKDDLWTPIPSTQISVKCNKYSLVIGTSYDSALNVDGADNYDEFITVITSLGFSIIGDEYPITYSSSNSIVSGPSSAAVGDTVTVSAVPDTGYGITDASSQILVTNNDVAVPYTWDAANNRITFTMPDPS